ncbi:hypothetical protein AMECASPLE_014097 [Ameca splendens]|uniref:Uncharacterized protein n=1 Tax=Ameca splendens TaxID=208324 RepID=A0ABV0ZYB7_9TELE
MNVHIEILNCRVGNLEFLNVCFFLSTPVVTIILLHQGGVWPKHQFYFTGTTINYRVSSPILSSIIHVQTTVIACLGTLDAWTCLLGYQKTTCDWKTYHKCVLLQQLCHNTCYIVTSLLNHMTLLLYTRPYLITVDRRIATVGGVSVILSSTAIFDCVSLSTLQPDNERNTK